MTALGGRQLSDRHLHELKEESAIDDEVIAERGYRTVTDAVELVRLGFADYQARAPALLVPLHGVDGSNGRYAIKPDRPRIRDGKPVKYDFQAGVRPILDVPPRCLEQLADPTAPLFFTEGAKKADCLAGLGYCAVDIWGVHNWYTNPEHGGFPTIEPLADWQPILPTLDGRLCFLVFDSDAWNPAKPSVGLALRRLANFLSRQGALVFVVRLPDAADGSKQGVDDLVASEGVDALEQLVDAARAWDWGQPGIVEQLQAEIRELRQQQSAQAAVLRNIQLTAAQKLVALATINEAAWRKSTGAPAPYTVNADRLRQAAGVKSTATVSSSLKVLCEDDRGLFQKNVTREYVEGVGWRSTMQLVPRADSIMGLLRAAATYTPERPERAKADRPRCPDHPLADVARRCTLVCTECGQLLPHQPEVVILNDKICSSDEDTTPGYTQDGITGGPSSGVKGEVFWISRCQACGGELDIVEQTAGFGLHLNCTGPPRP